MSKPKQVIIRPRSGAYKMPGTTIGGIEVTFDRFKGEVVVTGDYEIEEIDPNVYVQVQFVDPDPYLAAVRGKLYTYVDPGLGLEVGDLVDVPTVYQDHNVAVVKSLGDGYAGRAKREVGARYVRETVFQNGWHNVAEKACPEY